MLWTALIAGMASEAVPPPDRAITRFEQVCEDGRDYWGESLCGPTIFVEPATRAAIATENPGAGFEAVNGLWRGELPNGMAIANTAIELGGKRWAQILLPLPDDDVEATILIAHEHFHRIQPALGFSGKEAANAHLDTQDGRILARLEFHALAQALWADDWRPAAARALAYRAARLERFEPAAAQETALIANEGLAEYSGVRIGGGDRATGAALANLASGDTRPSLVRSFGYIVGPAYGLLLDRAGKPWRRTALRGTPLPKLLARNAALAVTSTDESRDGGATIRAEEGERESKRQQKLAELRTALVTGPTVTFPFEAMNIDFNPNSVTPLAGQGSVYRAATIRDSWGELKVTGDLLLSDDWSFARVAGPASREGDILSGPGWSILLKPGYELVAGENGSATVRKP